MDVEEILALERELTDEEFLFLERETLDSARAVAWKIEEWLPGIAARAPGLAERMHASVSRMVWALEQGSALPIGDKLAETEALKDLARTIRRQEANVYAAGDGPLPSSPGLVRASRRDRRRRFGRRRPV